MSERPTTYDGMIAAKESRIEVLTDTSPRLSHIWAMADASQPQPKFSRPQHWPIRNAERLRTLARFSSSTRHQSAPFRSQLARSLPRENLTSRVRRDDMMLKSRANQSDGLHKGVLARPPRVRFLALSGSYSVRLMCLAACS
jgi:hypothetical protein